MHYCDEGRRPRGILFEVEVQTCNAVYIHTYIHTHEACFTGLVDLGSIDWSGFERWERGVVRLVPMLYPLRGGGGNGKLGERGGRVR